MHDRAASPPSVVSFLIGGVVGASLAVLLAPEPGPAVRPRIRRGAVRAGAAKPLPARAARVPEPGLPLDMGRHGRG